MDENIIQVIGVIIASITSAKAWEYWITKVRSKDTRFLSKQEDSAVLRDKILEQMEESNLNLKEAQLKISALSERITELSVTVARHEATIEMLKREILGIEQENSLLKAARH